MGWDREGFIAARDGVAMFGTMSMGFQWQWSWSADREK